MIGTSDKICYLILPEGIKENLSAELEILSEKFGVSMVIVNDVNWNDDLTPWPAEGVFRKAKPFGGKASLFLEKLTKEIIPSTEKDLGINNVERTIVGVSLSGMFAVWAGFNTDAFVNIISISGSLWYDSFTDWMSGKTLSSMIKNVCLLLGEKEKNSKDKRIATVEDKTISAASIIRNNSQASVTFELVEGTHFSSITPRLDKAFEVVYGVK